MKGQHEPFMKTDGHALRGFNCIYINIANDFGLNAMTFCMTHP